jgi:hypothetical protein
LIAREQVEEVTAIVIVGEDDFAGCALGSSMASVPLAATLYAWPRATDKAGNPAISSQPLQ